MPTAATDPFRLPATVPGMRIGLFGGSFDPPHAGHREVSLVGLNALGLDQVWWLVSPQNPLKPDAPSQNLVERLAAADRLANHPRISATAIEATLGTTYTAETLRKLALRLPGVKLVWMMGADNLATFHHWKDWRAIAERVPIAVFNRPGLSLKALSSPAARTLENSRLPPSRAALLPEMAPPAWVFLPTPSVSLSSTALRAARPTS